MAVAQHLSRKDAPMGFHWAHLTCKHAYAVAGVAKMQPTNINGIWYSGSIALRATDPRHAAAVSQEQAGAGCVLPAAAAPVGVALLACQQRAGGAMVASGLAGAAVPSSGGVCTPGGRKMLKFWY